MAEGEAYLQLLCDVFGLDFDRAYSVFFTEPMFDLERKWALFEGQQIISILTTVPLEFGWGRAIGIAGVATRTAQRDEGYAGMLLDRVVKESAKRGEGPALLFAKRPELYEHHGFIVLDEVIRAPLTVRSGYDAEARMLSGAEVEALYTAWSLAEPTRLRRDKQRWNYWKWGMRAGTPVEGGYFCQEGSLVREAVLTTPLNDLPVTPDSEWLGLRRVAERLELPLGKVSEELLLMGYGVPGPVEMFMTDQF
jgi:N-acetylglutamate synthase-like GNAT family acetyltransferase